jgi:hypothetical protein
MDYSIMDVTFGITCFERPKELKRLLESIYKYFNNPNVIVVCDSKNPTKEKKLEKKYDSAGFYFEKYDVGLSKKRNIIIDKTKTKLILILEEDFIFEDNEGLNLALAEMNKRRLDLLAGRVENIYDFDLFHFIVAIKGVMCRLDLSFLNSIIKGNRTSSKTYGNFEISNNDLYININNKDLIEVDGVRFDLYPNFFIAQKSILSKLNGWQPEEIKVREHIIFFARLYDLNISSSFLYDFYILHRPKKRLLYLFKRYKKHKMNLSKYLRYNLKNDF